MESKRWAARTGIQSMEQIMASKISAGILLFRRLDGGLEFYLGHPGGPFFKKKDAGWWSIPKGLVEEGEDPVDAALREFEEETGISLNKKDLVPLGEVKQKGGKVVHAWACEWTKKEDPPSQPSNTFEMEWPPKSGKKAEFPELDRTAFFD